MLLTIFGAGASHDAVPPQFRSDDVVLPLTDDLFGNRKDFLDAMDRFPEVQTIIPLFRRPKDVSLEMRLEELQREAALACPGLTDHLVKPDS